MRSALKGHEVQGTLNVRETGSARGQREVTSHLYGRRVTRENRSKFPPAPALTRGVSYTGGGRSPVDRHGGRRLLTVFPLSELQADWGLILGAL
jgi:hypothetical protein